MVRFTVEFARAYKPPLTAYPSDFRARRVSMVDRAGVYKLLGIGIDLGDIAFASAWHSGAPAFLIVDSLFSSRYTMARLNPISFEMALGR